MNDSQRLVLQRHIKLLADDIMLTEELLAAMYQRKIFEWNMIEAIKAEKTHTDQLYRMLHMLPKRGPEAFENFVDILKTDYPWLAASLELKYKTEAESLSRQNSTVCMCGTTSARSEALTDGPKPPPVVEVQADSDIKTKVGMFIHKQFGHSKRISQHDKKTMEKWLSEQIQGERKTKIKTSVSEEPVIEPTERDACTSPFLDPIQQDLKRVYEKVRDENLSDLLNSEHATQNMEAFDNTVGADGSMGRASDECDSGSSNKQNAKDNIKTFGKTMTHLEGEIDKLINRMNHMEGLITQCHYILGDPDRKQKLPALVKDFQYVSRQYERDLSKEKLKAEKMLSEIYDFSKSIHKLESDKLHLRQDCEELKRDNEAIKANNAVLADKNKTLEDANFQHLEKEKTLANLRKMVNDLKTSHTSLADENSNYRINYGTGSFKSYRRPARVSRRGSMVEGTVPTVTRKPQTRTVVTTNRKKPSVLSRIP